MNNRRMHGQVLQIPEGRKEGIIYYNGQKYVFTAADLKDIDIAKLTKGMEVEFTCGKMTKDGQQAIDVSFFKQKETYNEKSSHSLSRGTKDRPYFGKTSATQQQNYRNSKEKMQGNSGNFNNSANSEKIRMYMPQDTYATLASPDFGSSWSIDNYALKFNKMPSYYVKNGKLSFYEVDLNDKRSPIRFTYPYQAESIKMLLAALQDRQATALCELGLEADIFDMSTEWRLVLGLGNVSVYETSMTLHHVYGVPYLPGSALKGVARAYAINSFYGGDEDKALQDWGFCTLFGSGDDGVTGAKQGAVVFFDSFPVQAPKLELDIMNPHYKDYYGGREPEGPTDWQNPRPIIFLTVTDTAFRIRLAQLTDIHTQLPDGKLTGKLGKKPLLVAKKLLQEALCWHGIGAKTALGYGILQIKN